MPHTPHGKTVERTGSYIGGKKGATGKRGQELIKLGVRVGQHTEPFLNQIQNLGLGQIEQYLSNGSLDNAPVRLAREGAADAVSQGQREAERSLASSGLANTPYAAAILGEQKMRGGLAVSQAERGAIDSYLSQLPALIQQPAASVSPFLGVPNAALAQGGNNGAGLAAASAYGAAGDAIGSLISGYYNRPSQTAVNTGNIQGPTYSGGNLSPTGPTG